MIALERGLRGSWLPWMSTQCANQNQGFGDCRARVSCRNCTDAQSLRARLPIEGEREGAYLEPEDFHDQRAVAQSS